LQQLLLPLRCHAATGVTQHRGIAHSPKELLIMKYAVAVLAAVAVLFTGFSFVVVSASEAAAHRAGTHATKHHASRMRAPVRCASRFAC
jgi:hypothetical protein